MQFASINNPTSNGLSSSVEIAARIAAGLKKKQTQPKEPTVADKHNQYLNKLSDSDFPATPTKLREYIAQQEELEALQAKQSQLHLPLVVDLYPEAEICMSYKILVDQKEKFSAAVFSDHVDNFKRNSTGFICHPSLIANSNFPSDLLNMKLYFHSYESISEGDLPDIKSNQGMKSRASKESLTDSENSEIAGCLNNVPSTLRYTIHYRHDNSIELRPYSQRNLEDASRSANAKYAQALEPCRQELLCVNALEAAKTELLNLQKTEAYTPKTSSLSSKSSQSEFERPKSASSSGSPFAYLRDRVGSPIYQRLETAANQVTNFLDQPVENMLFGNK